ncbi:hypothetical protein BDQ12DRAFT_728838 [Crucibulum laeve]|uniref:Uncharacterized protein n=1 Tax=Crucibulum laeve TaxID=68775 RepID=A0A5C3LHE6_9AGAR|nr:hypothetical protein BDQ12DRAFT_728838 [Crucibulum laeve]
MSQYTLNVKIDTDDLQRLKKSGYKLCIAKKVNGIYNVVWYCEPHYFANNAFDWTEEYEVFGIKKFKEGALVKASTNPHDIESGLTCEINESGVMSDSFGSADSSGKFKVINNFGQVSIGINAKLGDDMLPIFVTPTTVTETALFEPIIAVQVWFSMSQTKGMMILAADSDVMQIKYQGKVKERTVTFVDGKWVLQH